MTQEILLHRLLGPSDADGRIYGVVTGVVSNNRDPEGMHRVRLRFPWLDPEQESNWARVVAIGAGDDRGAYFLPEVDDEVLVAFEHGSVEHPFVVGSLWNGKDRPPESNDDGRNDHRTIKSRSGHIIRLSDAAGEEAIEIIDRTGSNRIVITSADNAIAIEAQGDISIRSSTGKITIEGVGVEVRSSLEVKIEAQTQLDASASGPVSIKGAMVNIN